MRTPLCAAVAAALTLSSPSFAQNAGSPEADQPTTVVKPLPGQKAGTESWIVHFKNRPFDLLAFRAEMHSQRRVEVVDGIVKDLEAKMQAHQKGFAADVVALSGRVTHQWWLINGMCIEIAPQHLAALRTMNNVAFIEPNAETFPQIKTATNSNNHNSDALNARNITGLGVATAIIDTGQDSSRAGSGTPHITYSVNGTSTTRLVANIKLGAMVADDVHGHGTGVASIAAGYRWRTTQADNGHAPRAPRQHRRSRDRQQHPRQLQPRRPGQRLPARGDRCGSLPHRHDEHELQQLVERHLGSLARAGQRSAQRRHLQRHLGRQLRRQRREQPDEPQRHVRRRRQREHQAPRRLQLARCPEWSPLPEHVRERRLDRHGSS